MAVSQNDREGAAVIVTAVMTDHPSWLSSDTGTSYRAVRCGTSVWALTSTPIDSGHHETTAHHVSGIGDPPVVDVLDPATLTGEQTVVAPLRAAGIVARWRNPDLWDALATSIVRQVIRAGHARTLYRTFCQAHGEPVTTPMGATWLFPTPETVLALPDVEFARLGLAFKRRPLRAAAQAYREFGPKWAKLDPPALAHEVQTVPRIGPWTAGATVADLSNDYALYPFADLAVRTWAKQMAPGRIWPETEPEFASVWARLAGEQLPAWTLLTLAWGFDRGSVGHSQRCLDSGVPRRPRPR
jgi:DNA-3-methyladenine glycosylase II